MSSAERLILTLLVALTGACQCHILRIHSGRYLDDLPGHVAAQGHQHKAVNLDISLVDVVVEGPKGSDGKPLVRFTGKAYRNNYKGVTHSFGPTVRLRRGGNFTIRLTNDLVAAPGETLAAAKHNRLTLPSFTNMHTHGIWGDPGVHSQPALGTTPEYEGHDNIFVAVAPRPNTSVPHGETLTYRYSIPHNHMPGFSWYHPHFHGSSGLQTATAKGAIVVEGEEEFLPSDNGCDPLKSLLVGGAKEWIMQVEGWFFGGSGNQSQPSTSSSYAKGDRSVIHDTYPDISARHHPKNPTCCKGGSDGFLSAGQDFLTVNGGYQPVVKMEDGVWQRWRMVYAAYMSYLDLTWTNSRGDSHATCEVLLLAKDGIFLQQIPRAISHVLLPSGGRADLLVRCSGSAGSRLEVASGYGPMSEPLSECNLPTCRVVQQRTLLTIELRKRSLIASKPLIDLEREACTPLRPSHLTDLRDGALEKAGYDKQQLVRGSIMFVPKTVGDVVGVCTVNGDLFSFPDSGPLVAPLGGVVEWALLQTSFHPHHLHTLPMQIVGLPDILGGSFGGGMTGRGGVLMMPGRRLLGHGHGGVQSMHSSSDSSVENTESRGAAGVGKGVNGAARRRLQQGMMGGMMGGEDSHVAAMQEAGMTQANEDAWAKLTTYFKVGDFHDTLLIPLNLVMGGAATVRFQPGHFTGYSVHHCHYLQHEDQGCMKIVKWQCPGYEGNEQPAECEFEFPVKGTLPFGPDGKPLAATH